MNYTPTTQPAKPRTLVKPVQPVDKSAGVRQVPETPKPASMPPGQSKAN